MEPEALRELAELAKLRLTPEQEARALARMDRVLAAFEGLAEAPTEAVEPSPYPLPIAHRTRPDEIEPPLSQDEVLALAPEKRSGCFRVPRMVDG